MFSADISAEIARTAESLGVEPAALLAVAEVESGGRAFALVQGRREPLIRFEGHYFDRRLSEPARAVAREMGLAAPVAGAIANPPTQAGRWKMLERAVAIDARAACESVSWGLGQVMGAHWRRLEYPSVDALVAQARSGVAGQAQLMARYIENAGLAKALRSHDWQAFAHGYNGPGYRNYDEKIAAAYARYAGKPGARPAALRRGSRGEAVRTLQRDLSALGYDLAVDGVFGPRTAGVVRRFQQDRGLAADGIAGPRTLAALAQARGPQSAPARWWQVLLAWLKAPFGDA